MEKERNDKNRECKGSKMKTSKIENMRGKKLRRDEKKCESNHRCISSSSSPSLSPTLTLTLIFTAQYDTDNRILLQNDLHSACSLSDSFGRCIFRCTSRQSNLLGFENVLESYHTETLPKSSALWFFYLTYYDSEKTIYHLVLLSTASVSAATNVMSRFR